MMSDMENFFRISSSMIGVLIEVIYWHIKKTLDLICV